MSDNEGGGGMVAEHLLELGHRQFGYLMPPPRHVDAPARLAGVRRALRVAGIEPDGLQVARGEALVWGGEVAADELLDRSPETTAFIAYNDLMAIGALRALRRRGRRVPAEVSVAGFDDVALAAYVDPPLTTIAQRTDAMGRWAVARLVGEDGLGPASVQLPVDLRIRESTGPPPPA
jgi:DNA-binding LacI/PurR family transcriptional regulator